ncbi:Myb-like DNA-binding domain protein [Aspergillus ellipticus CBS 707.79]|uniref:Myb-like DNA-binding domain protein n=1 Tax=Aspergillus ellipticus CBS 707.79 TaxID=1448320 RepID=A0A319EAP7_9EURO|nr:Myb-like DNA-binding domain protein [Aspergillus ellipticus CBS 707.79]
MERPTKRPRLSNPVETEGEADDVDIYEARAQNDLRLKSIFEGIFEKYGQDFTEVGDEIDLQSGEIVVNNGHIQAMDGEDTGERSGWLFETDLAAPPDQDDAGDVTWDHSVQHSDADPGGDGAGYDGTQSPHPPASIASRTGLGTAQAMADEAANDDQATNDDRSSVDSLLDTALCVQNDPSASRGRQALADASSKAGRGKANPAAEASAQSKKVKFSEAVEAIWRVPEISGGFSTPTLNRSRPAPPLNIVRSQSPPGTGSLWALPRRGSGQKRAKNPQSERKHHSSPVVCDWSFAEAPDGDESDDPLQDNYEPSPTPKGGVKHRGPKSKRILPTSPTKDRCDHCQQYFARDDYIAHVKEVLSKPEVGRPLSTVANPRAAETASAGKPGPSSVDTTKAPTTSPSTAGYDTSPTKKRPKTVISPDEARLIITLRTVQGKRWNEVLDQLPQKNLPQLFQWNRIHWIDRRANPPPLTRPWTKPEREKLNQLKEQRGLSWPAIRAELCGRPLAEIEFELLQLWAGGDVSHKEDGKLAAREDKS